MNSLEFSVEHDGNGGYSLWVHNKEGINRRYAMGTLALVGVKVEEVLEELM